MTDKPVPAEETPAAAELALKPDLRQSATALDICRGVQRLLLAHGYACVTELPLASGRRADVAAISAHGDIAIVEIKSSIEDFRADHKWQDYLEFCDRLYFAVKPGFATEILPAATGLMLADRYGGEIVRAAPEARLSAARRKAVTLRVARTAALRLGIAIDPALGRMLGAVD
jgi:hypothetical protein